jgi:DNA-binding response OmpR family regulator
MAEATLPARLVEIESMLDRSRRRFEEGTRLVEEAHKLLASLKATGSEMPESLCGGRLSVDQVQRLIRIDGHPIGSTEMEYRVLELLAFARNNVVTRQMLLKHLYRRADDQPQPKIIDVFISKLRKKLRNASGGAEFIETIPQRGWILRDIDEKSGV